MLLSYRDPAEVALIECNKCHAPRKYLYDHKAWCRTCLDIEQYPNSAHLTQEEREQNRITISKADPNRGMINGGNIKKQSTGFGV